MYLMLSRKRVYVAEVNRHASAKKAAEPGAWRYSSKGGVVLLNADWEERACI